MLTGSFTNDVARVVRLLMMAELRQEGTRGNSQNSVLPIGFGTLSPQEQAIWFLRRPGPNTATYVCRIMNGVLGGNGNDAV